MTEFKGKVAVITGAASEFAGKLHGWGEAAWIWDGRVISTSGMGHHPECFEPFTRQLLEKAEADA